MKCTLPQQCICQFPAVVLADYPPSWIKKPPLDHANLWSMLVSIVLIPLVWFVTFRSVQQCGPTDHDGRKKLIEQAAMHEVRDETAEEFQRSRASQKGSLLQTITSTGLISVLVGMCMVIIATSGIVAAGTAVGGR